jgi:serine/threonine protein kinase
MISGLEDLPPKFEPVVEDLSKRISFESINLKGANGYVLVGSNRIIDRKVVVKFYYWGDGAHAEPKLLVELASPHVLQVFDAAAVDADDAYFMTPYCEHGDLDDVMQAGPVNNLRAVDIILEVASGANFIHSAGFIHRDLKPSNIFCDGARRFVIGDFGSIVQKSSLGYAQTISKHSLLYRTPEEIVEGRAYEQSDIYQIGIVLYQLLGGKLSYDEADWLSPQQLKIYGGKMHPDNQLYAASIIEGKIRAGKLLDYSTLADWCPPELVSIIRKCCQVKWSSRFESVSALMVKLNNTRHLLADWRCEPDPILYRKGGMFRISESEGTYTVEKRLGNSSSWRKQRKLGVCKTYKEAIKLAEDQ